MGMNIVEKILAGASGAAFVAPGEFVDVDVETMVMIDPNFRQGNWREVLKVADPSKVVIAFDHFVPASDAISAQTHSVGRTFARRFGIKRLHDVGFDQGISHALVADHAYALPGTVLINSDSHTCGAGAFNCAARGVGLPDMLYAITKGKTWFRVGETIRYDLKGHLAPGITAKDVFLHIAGEYGAHVTQNLEFGGSGMSSLSVNGRRTLAIMGAELSAEFVIFEPDELLIDYIRERNPIAFSPMWPDTDALYKERRVIDLTHMKSLVALPDGVVNNCVTVSEVAGEPIHQAFIGSCANGTLDDLSIAATVLSGRRVAPGVRLIVTPGSQAIYRAALSAGYVEKLTSAGAVVTSATCGACAGGHMGVLGPGEICITASTSNFKGRMGDSSARIYMASPATVAASALAGKIADPAKYFREDAR